MSYKTLVLLGTTTILGIFAVVIKSLVVPMMLGVDEFGYWQVFLLYTSFLYISYFGYNDGLILKYAGHEKIDKEVIFSSASIMVSFSTLFVFLIYFIGDVELPVGFFIISPLMALLAFLSTYLNNKGNSRAYRNYIIVDKLCFLSLLFMAYLFFEIDSEVLIAIEVLSKFILLLILTSYCNKFEVFSFFKVTSLSFSEYLNDISIGSKIMLSGTMSILILNVGRFYVEASNTVEYFSNYSFSLSINNIAILAVSIFSVGIFPVLKRKFINKEVFLYELINDLVSLANLLIIPFYMFVVYFLIGYYEDFTLLSKFIFITISFIPFYVRNSLLYFSFVKILRLESGVLKITGIVFLISNIVYFFLIDSKVFDLFPILTLVFLFCYSFILGAYISKQLKIKFKSGFLSDIGVVFVVFVNHASHGSNVVITVSLLYVLIFFGLYLYRLNKSIARLGLGKLSLR